MAKSIHIEKSVPQSEIEGAGFATLAVRAGQVRTQQLEHSEAIFPTSSFVFNDAAEAARRFAGEEPGNIYSRFTNPTVSMFEERMAALEGAEKGVATSSGMAAILAVFMAMLKSEDHVVCSRSVFGTTNVLLEKYMGKMGIASTFVDLVDYQQWQAAIRPQTRILFLETPTNPLCEVADIERLADIARKNACLLVVDNCFCTPALQRPLQLGADIVVHSATKYLDGQGRCVGGIVVGSDKLMTEVFGFLRSAGTTLSPFNAWVFLKGLETLDLRMKAHSAAAEQVALWLDSHPGVRRVHYAGLPSHPQHELAKRQQKGFGGVLSFEVAGGREAAWKVIDGMQMVSITANLGDVKTTVTHPATTTHGRLPEEEKRKAGITESLVRISVGLECVDDIIADLSRGLATL